MNKNFLAFKTLPDNTYLMMSIQNDMYYHINNTAYIIFKTLADGANVGEVCNVLVQNYDVKRLEALEMVDSCIQQLSSPEVVSDFDRDLLLSPFRIGWNLTNRCNLKCKHCYTRANEIELEELDTDQMMSIADALIESEVLDVVLTGGEPLLRKDFGDIFRKLYDSHISLTVFTNATLVDNHIDIIGERFARFIVSLDGLEDVHDNIRGKGAFRKAVEGIMRLKNAGQHVMINTTLSRMLIEEFQSFLQFVYEDLDVNLQMGMMLPYGRAVDNSDILSTADMYEKAMECIISYSRLHGKNVAGVVSGENHVKTLYINEKGSTYIGKDIWKCNAGYSKVTIRPNGDVYPCPFCREYRMGNLVEDDYRKVWVNNNRKKFIQYISLNQSRICAPVQQQIMLRKEAH